MSEGPATSLWSNRDFKLVLFGQGLSAFGSALSFTALPLLVASLTRSGLQLGVVGALETLPAFAFCLFAGAHADRRDRRKLMLYSDLACAALTGLVPLALLLGLPLMPVLYLVAAPLGVLGVVFVAAYTAALLDLVGREHVGAANAYHQVVVTFGAVLGPGLAGYLLGQIGVAATLLLDALTFLIAAAATALVRRSMRGAPRAAPLGVRAEIGEALRFLADHRLMRVTAAFYTAVMLVTAPLIAAVTFYVTIELGGDQTAFGLLLSVYSVGNVVGYVAAARLTRGRLGRLMLAANLGFGLAVAALALARSGPAQAAACLFAGAFSALTHIPYVTLRTTHTPDALIGRVSSALRMLHLGAQPLGLLLGGLWIDATSGTATLLAIAGLSLALSLGFAASTTLRSAVPLDRPPPGPEDMSESTPELRVAASHVPEDMSESTPELRAAAPPVLEDMSESAPEPVAAQHVQMNMSESAPEPAAAQHVQEDMSASTPELRTAAPPGPEDSHA